VRLEPFANDQPGAQGDVALLRTRCQLDLTLQR
jgi:hypothetical protein